MAAAGAINYFNPAPLQRALAVQREDPRAILPADVAQIVRDCLATSQSQPGRQTQFAGRTLDWAFHPVTASRVVHACVADITDRLSLEAQLRQSQKRESVGLLAAGVAHDFNNMLTIIRRPSGRVLARPNLEATLFESAQAIYFAAERAAGLTRQLLMFSRKNVLQSQLLDLRELVATMTKMVKQGVGETVALEFHPPPELPAVQGDVGMLEQVLMNLVVNARDAMPKGSTLTLTLEALDLDQLGSR